MFLPLSQRLLGPGILLLAAVAAGCGARRAAVTAPSAPFPRQEIIAEIKDFQKTLGFEEQQNFLHYSDEQRALYRCYYTGKLELPDSYDRLRLVDGDVAGCSLDEARYDVFFYEMEAAATGDAPVTPSLTEAPLERLLVVVAHEDFHNQKETERADTEIAEAASTLIGFLAASQFAKEKYGTTSETYERLNREPGLFLQKARMVNSYYSRVRSLYGSFRAKRISREEALRRKQELFSALERECSAIAPVPASFNPCPGIGNNAGLAFERTYSRYYPQLYELSESQDRDAAATVAALKRLLAARPRSERDLLRLLGELSEEARFFHPAP